MILITLENTHGTLLKEVKQNQASKHLNYKEVFLNLKKERNKHTLLEDQRTQSKMVISPAGSASKVYETL